MEHCSSDTSKETLPTLSKKHVNLSSCEAEPPAKFFRKDTISRDNEVTQPIDSATKTTTLLPTTTEQNETLHRCDLRINREQVNLELHQLIWCDAGVNESTDIVRSLREIIDYTKMFDNVDECHHYIHITPNIDTFLVCSGNYAEILVPKIRNLKHVHSIYIYCTNKSVHEQWSTQFAKVKQIYNQLQPLLITLEEDVKQYLKQEKNGIFRGVDDLHHTTVDTPWWSYFMYMLCHLPYPDNSCVTFIRSLRKYYDGKESELKVLDEFEKTYTAERAVWWYTRDTFLYRLLNKALRQQNIEVLFLFGFYLTDIYNQLKNEHRKLQTASECESTITVYRGQVMPLEEKEDFEDVIQCEIMRPLKTIKSLFSTSLNRSMVQILLDPSAKRESALQNILFKIKLDTKNQSHPFGKIAHLSNFPSEDEVLLMPGIRLEICEIAYDDDINANIVKLVQRHDENLPEDDFISAESVKRTLKDCLFRTLNDEFLVEPEALDVIFNSLNNFFPDESAWMKAVKYQLLAQYYSQEEERSVDKQMWSYEQALNIYQKFINDDELEIVDQVAELHYHIGDIYLFEKQDNDVASIHYNLGINCCNTALLTNTSSKQRVKISNLMGDIYSAKSKLNVDEDTKTDNITNAIKYYELQLSEILKCYPSNHIKIANCLEHIGELQESIFLFDEALNNHTKALQNYYQEGSIDAIADQCQKICKLYIEQKHDYVSALPYKQIELEYILKELVRFSGKHDENNEFKPQCDKEPSEWLLEQTKLEVAECYIETSEIYVKLRQFQHAHENLSKAKHIREEINTKDEDDDIKRLDEKTRQLDSLLSNNTITI